ncbi:hypothetical protein NO2_1095 [Candidatus Termititenax persephonae]|uniref:DNA-directed RNA polymerase subunit alpha n=1 Tax=Candidatus Termititenax persephonae TaxID=2218525 RepID=A0A388TI43_9BACT|nr:hypothetical protein NO2_1095 [Candidatus Termititenax persephonae]
MANPWVKYTEMSPTYGVFTAEPLERGYGTTLGTILQRILLASLGGAAVTSVKIDALEGVEEAEVLANIKNLALKSFADAPVELKLSAKDGVVTARDIEHGSEVEIVNPDLHIATLGKGARLNLTLTVERGVGYHLADESKSKDGLKVVNASFTPIVKVNRKIEPARVGKSLDYDRLILEVWTNGVLSPEEAIRQSAQLVKDQMDSFINPADSKNPSVKHESKDKNYGVFTADPLDKGYGTTLGNALRRILLSSIGGAAITTVKIEGVDHEFSTIDGIKEDVLDIIANIKTLAVKSHSDSIVEMTLSAKDECEVTAGDIQHDDEVEIINPKHHLATLNKGAKLNIKFTVEKGVGYQVADVAESKNHPIGTLPIDASFSPVVKVNHQADSGRKNHDVLALDVWTNGTLSPEEAVRQSSQILQNQIDIFQRLNQRPTDGSEAGGTAGGALGGLALSIDDLELSARSSNCLKKAAINSVAELVNKPLEDLLKIKNFGKKSAEEINTKLAQYGLKLKGDISDLSNLFEEEE